MKLKILLISNLYPSNEYPFYGTFVRQFVKSFEKIGVDCSNKVVMTKHPLMLARFFRYLYFYFRVIYKTFFSSYDLIYVHFVNHTLLPFYFIRRFVKKPLVVNAHGADVIHEAKRSQWIWKLAKKVIRSADLLVVPSQYFKSIVVKNSIAMEDRIVISPSAGVSSRFIEASPIEDYGNTLKIGYLGRMDPDKGYDTFLSSIANLNESPIKLLVHAAGGGSELGKFKSLLKKYRLDEMVKYHGFLSHDKVPDFFSLIDVLVFPSRRKGESLGLVPIEALAAGVPVIAFNNGAVSEYVIDGYNGYIYDVDSNELLMRTITKFVDLSLSEKRQMSLNAKKIGAGFESDRVAKKLLDTLKKKVLQHEP